MTNFQNINNGFVFTLNDKEKGDLRELINRMELGNLDLDSEELLSMKEKS